MKKQPAKTKLAVMRSIVRDLTEVRGGAIFGTGGTVCGAETNGKDRGNNRTACKPLSCH